MNLRDVQITKAKSRLVQGLVGVKGLALTPIHPLPAADGQGVYGDCYTPESVAVGDIIQQRDCGLVRLPGGGGEVSFAAALVGRPSGGR